MKTLRKKTLTRLLLFTLLGSAAAQASAASETSGLRSVESFDSISKKSERSVALFVEIGKVLTHPRCINCHPDGDQPLQGNSDRLHEPPVERGRTGFGVTGMRCRTCHSTENYDPGRVPGAPLWHLAPSKMAWEGLSLTELCEQLKDPERNGGRSLDEIHEHMAEDALVGWGWTPGADREPTPGTQEAFGELVRAWIKSGAACP